MGQPGGTQVPSSPAEYIGRRRRTRGSETSQYPEEKKSTEIPGVVASETGRAQTVAPRSGGVVGPAQRDRELKSKLSGKQRHRG